MRMFSGLISWCMMFLACRVCIAAATSPNSLYNTCLGSPSCCTSCREFISPASVMITNRPRLRFCVSGTAATPYTRSVVWMIGSLARLKHKYGRVLIVFIIRALITGTYKCWWYYVPCAYSRLPHLLKWLWYAGKDKPWIHIYNKISLTSWNKRL